MSARLVHEQEDEGEGIVLRFAGEIDLSNSREVRRIILRAIDRHVHTAVDLSRVAYMDSSSIANLIEAFHTAKKKGRDLRILAVSQPVEMALRMACIYDALVE